MRPTWFFSGYAFLTRGCNRTPKILIWLSDYKYRPAELELTNITPAHKKLSRTEKVNYRPISVLPSISKFSKNFFIDSYRTL